MSIESQMFLQFVLAAFTAVIASFVTARFALRRFYSEKWREKKYEGYNSILESLHYIAHNFYEEEDAAENGRGIPDGRKDELSAKFREAEDDLAKRIDVGQFVISAAAVAVLATFQKELGSVRRANDFPEYIERGGKATTKALQQMRAIAKRDLERSYSHG